MMSEMQDILNEQIEIKLQAFEYEVKIRLDLAEAKKYTDDEAKAAREAAEAEAYCEPEDFCCEAPAEEVPAEEIPAEDKAEE